MSQTLLDTAEDLEWLHSIHGIPITRVRVAILYGNKDCPHKVETYTRNSVNCKPITYIYNELEDRYDEVH